ncbi:hypothetical protein V6N13_032610 [Hibiscus sabdariffa]|uniref:Uncharacterized protein n=1 Tax=Hibiscus sabdariffa TaxID=183260 RepID=A0ABR2FCM4_9ROSI
MSTPRTEAIANTYEIEEEEEEIQENNEERQGQPLASIKEIEEMSSVFSFDVNSVGARNEDSVYVAVGKSQSSLDALSWTLSHFVDSSANATTVFLVHVFPEIHYIPSPSKDLTIVGKLPKSQVSAAQVETYMAQERRKRRQLLQKYLDMCTASKVKVDTMLVESDMVAKAIIDLIPILNITKLVVGTRKVKSKRSGGIAHQIFESAPKTCEVKVVCEGKDATANMLGSPSPSDSYSPTANENYFQIPQSQKAYDDRRHDSFACMCFKPKF